MIVEFPRPTYVASPFKRLKIALARQDFLNNCGAVASSFWLKLTGSITIVGVGLNRRRPKARTEPPPSAG